MKRLSVFMLSVLVLILFFTGAAFANGFSEDPDAVEQKLKSVLMLEVYSDGKVIATGSGFCAFDNRTLVTNYHVIKDADSLIAYSDSGNPYFVFHVLIADADRDIAILSFFSPTDLMPLSLNTDGPLRRAEKVVAIGSPLGITNTVASGIISGIYTDEGVSMIQFTAPISHGSSGGALFDDSGSVIGITTSTLTEGQNVNLAVHISEAAALYRSWDGSRTEMDEYRPGRSSRTTAASKLSPTPKPIVTPDTSNKSKGDNHESNKKLEITSVNMRSNGDVFLEWSGGTGPYKVCYQIVDNNSQNDVLDGRFYWSEEESTYITSTVMKFIAPDHLYRIDVIDKSGTRVSEYYRNTAVFSSSVFSKIELRRKENGSISKSSLFSCSALEASVKDGAPHGILYGIYCEVDRVDSIKNYDFTMRIAIDLPNGDIIVHTFDAFIYGRTYWKFIDFSPIWEKILTQYKQIPTGGYRFSVYMDNTLLATRVFIFI